MERRREVGAVLALTFVSGCVDALSFLGLGGVFVANITGNVAILGFALLSEHPGQGVRAGLSLVCFAVGALVGGRLSAPLSPGVPWTRGVNRVLVLETVLLAMATVLLGSTGEQADADGAVRYGVIVIVSLAMGLQGAAARRVAIPDVPTTVVTSTLTALMVDSRLAGGAGTRWQRRAGAVTALFAGAACGGMLMNWLPLYSAAALACGVTGSVAIAGILRARGLRRDVA